ncbi:endonuclease domain-containing protein [Microterricola viridarii]|uniref:DUF559 domain-containing protein n=1 Tax=Microterricola viridarii TaxID=412690 RepID=A0A0X8E4P7_9MICO|nr:DUF559 domain-containing protein [Microterricola viridarii]AMB59662.1 hypothetical protein AWU67_13195 [Microterricola viridarii]
MPIALVSQVLASLGGVAHYSGLERAGVSRSAVAAALRRGEVFRVRNGWFACAGAPAELVRAVRVGGTLTGASAAALYGLWTIADPLLHLRVRSSTSRLSAPSGGGRLVPGRHGVCVHYRSERVSIAADPLLRALAEMFNCSDEVSALVALDSALNSGKLGVWQLPELKALILSTRRASVDKADAGSQSGLETIVRLLMRSHGVRLRSQVQIAGVGRVDLLIGDRLVVELDGRGFHAGRFEEDRERDWELIQRGYLVVRVSYAMVMHQRERVEAGLLALVRRGVHRGQVW